MKPIMTADLDAKHFHDEDAARQFLGSPLAGWPDLPSLRFGRRGVQDAQDRGLSVRRSRVPEGLHGPRGHVV
jgi:hypothetical protein